MKPETATVPNEYRTEWTDRETGGTMALVLDLATLAKGAADMLTDYPEGVGGDEIDRARWRASVKRGLRALAEAAPLYQPDGEAAGTLWIRFGQPWTNNEDTPDVVERGPYREVAVDSWGSTMTATAADGTTIEYGTAVDGRWLVDAREFGTATVFEQA
jgi:hypothetical protein